MLSKSLLLHAIITGQAYNLLFLFAIFFGSLLLCYFPQTGHCDDTSADPPRKRVDTRPSKSYRAEMLANGSPIAPRRFPYG